MQDPDESLALAAQQGDRLAFTALVTRHYPRILALGWRLTGSRPEAEDLAQDICAALGAKLAHWRPEARFTTWLYRVIVNAAHDRRRRAQSYARATEGWGDWEIARQAEASETREALDWLQSAMAGLSPDLRDTVALVLGEDLTQAQAAEVLGLSDGTVAWRMSEVKKHLRKLAASEERS